MELSRHRAIITGANRGLGVSIAIAFVEAGPTFCSPPVTLTCSIEPRPRFANTPNDRVSKSRP